MYFLPAVIFPVLASILVVCIDRKIGQIIPRKLFTLAIFILFEAHKNKTGSLSAKVDGASRKLLDQYLIFFLNPEKHIL